jgi:formate--tetrahydrofolate ligase
MALKMGEYAVTEAGFGADLGAEKFFDIKCRIGGLVPDAVVIVASVRALKHHGGAAKADLCTEDLRALERGLPNLARHAENIREVFGLPAVAAVNVFPADTEAELRLVENRCGELGIKAVRSDVWAKGGEGGAALAEEVVRLAAEPKDFRFCYSLESSVTEKLEAIAKRVYRADGVVLAAPVQKKISRLEALGFGSLPVCMAKTQYSFSDNPKLIGAPDHFSITVSDIKVNAGAGFIVAFTGDVMTMPGLPKTPAAEGIDVDNDGKITGLF